MSKQLLSPERLAEIAALVKTWEQDASGTRIVKELLDDITYRQIRDHVSDLWNKETQVQLDKANATIKDLFRGVKERAEVIAWQAIKLMHAEAIVVTVNDDGSITAPEENP